VEETVRRTISVEEAGRQLGIGRNTAYEAARAGQIPTIRIGKRLVVPVAAFERLLDCDDPKGAK
jgi:excisionase family DNA binding protein